MQKWCSMPCGRPSLRDENACDVRREDVRLTYLTFSQDNHQHHQEKIISLLEKCCRSFTADVHSERTLWHDSIHSCYIIRTLLHGSEIYCGVRGITRDTSTNRQLLTDIWAKIIVEHTEMWLVHLHWEVQMKTYVYAFAGQITSVSSVSRGVLNSV
jgi:hypothetical protein